MSINNEEAKKILEQEWKYVKKHSNNQFLNTLRYTSLVPKINSIIRGKQVTYKYILFTAALSKVVNPKIHYRALQKQSTLDGAYDARSVAHGVIVPFEKSNGEKLGGSNEPYLNRPARYTEFDLSNRDRNKKAQKKLYEILEFSQNEASSNKNFPKLLLQQVLKEVFACPTLKYDFTISPVKIGLGKTEEIIKKFLAESGNGERLVAVSKAIFSSLNYVYEGKQKISAYPVNWSDEFAKVAGDLEFRLGKKLIKAGEVKDKPLTENDIQHCAKKAKKNLLSEYLVVVGAGIEDGHKDKIETKINTFEIEGININLITAPEGFFPYLLILGELGRKKFLEDVGVALNEIKASRYNKNAWQTLFDEEFS